MFNLDKIVLAGLLLVNITSCNEREPIKNNEFKNQKPHITKSEIKGKVLTCRKPLIKPAGKPSVVMLPKGNMGGYVPMQTYNTEQGLALSSVSCGFMDKIGNLWFGTYGGGVSRYDGKSFTNFTTLAGLSHNTIYSITEDLNGNIWFGTDGHGVDCYNGRTFINYSTTQGLINNIVRSILQDRNGNLWFGTDGGISRYDGKSFINYTTGDGIVNNKVRSIAEDKKGNLWFGTFGGGVSCYNGKSFTNYTSVNGLADNTVSGIVEDNDGNIWFGTNKGASRFNGKSFTNYTTEQGLTNNIIRKITKDKKGNLWFATFGGGVNCYDGKFFTGYTKTTSGLANDFILNITIDQPGNLWFGTFGDGISRYDGKSLSYYTTAHGLAGDHVRCVAEDNKGNLWFGTDGGGVSKYDGRSFTNYKVEQGLPDNNVWCMSKDTSGNIWFGTYGGGVSCYNGKSFTNYTTAQGLTSNKVLCIINDKKGNLWFGTDTGGVICYDGKSFINYTTAQGLAHNNVWCSIRDKKDNLWFGTFGGGVSRYDGKHFTNFTTADGLANNTILCIAEDKNGNLWFGTDGGGVSRYDGKTFITFASAQDLANDEVYAMVIDKQGNIILGTNMGLSVLKGFVLEQKNIPGFLKEKECLFKNNKEVIFAPSNSLANSKLEADYKPVFEEYNQKTGYQIKDINTNAMLCDSKNIIWAGCGDNKLSRFDYNSVNKNLDPPRVFIQSVKVQNENICWYDISSAINLSQETPIGFDTVVKSQKSGMPSGVSPNIVEEATLPDGKPLNETNRNRMREEFNDIRFTGISLFYSLPQNLVLPYQHNQITFDFGVVDPAKFSLTRFQYMLKGYDKVWSPVTYKTSATFGNISEGDYTFLLRARNPYRTWSDPIEFSFKVLPPWYRTWWAYSIYILFLLGVLRFYIYLREYYLKREKKLLVEKILVQKEAKERLERSEVRLKLAQKIAHFGSWELDFSTGIANWSEEACRIYGISPKNNIQSYEFWKSFIHPQDLNYVMEEIEKGRTTLSNTSFYHRIIRENGALRHIHSHISFELNNNGVPIGLNGVAHDISEIKQAEEAFKQANENLLLIVDLIPQAIFARDIKGKFIFVNRNFAQLYGLVPQQVVNKTLPEIIPGNNQPHYFLREDQEIIQSDSVKIIPELDFIDFSGKKRTLSVVKMPYVIPGTNEKAILGVIIDITSQKIAEDERAKITNDIIHRNNDLEQFSYSVSHNLRLPVANIMGLTDLLQMEEIDAKEKKEMIPMLASSAKILDNVIKDLNHILQVKGQVHEKKELVKFSDILDDVKSGINNILKIQNVTIIQDFSSIDEIYTIKSFLYSIFFNLVTNGIKYNKPGIPALLEITSSQEKNEIGLAFKDSGLGIDLEKNGDQVFGMYKRFHFHTEGKGIGLYLVKQQVEILGGKISIKSEVNKGTTFTIVFKNN